MHPAKILKIALHVPGKKSASSPVDDPSRRRYTEETALFLCCRAS